MTKSTDEKNKKPDPGESWSDEPPDSHLERDDNRWNSAAQVRDWLVLIVMIVIYLVWVGTIYFLEPGIR